MRSDILSLTREQVQNFRDAMQSLQEDTSIHGYSHIAAFHGQPNWCPSPDAENKLACCAHGMATFPHWHSLLTVQVSLSVCLSVCVSVCHSLCFCLCLCLCLSLSLSVSVSLALSLSLSVSLSISLSLSVSLFFVCFLFVDLTTLHTGKRKHQKEMLNIVRRNLRVWVYVLVN